MFARQVKCEDDIRLLNPDRQNETPSQFLLRQRDAYCDCLNRIGWPEYSELSKEQLERVRTLDKEKIEQEKKKEPKTPNEIQYRERKSRQNGIRFTCEAIFAALIIFIILMAANVVSDVVSGKIHLAIVDSVVCGILIASTCAMYYFYNNWFWRTSKEINEVAADAWLERHCMTVGLPVPRK